jgi:hypothetical protein
LREQQSSLRCGLLELLGSSSEATRRNADNECVAGQGSERDTQDPQTTSASKAGSNLTYVPSRTGRWDLLLGDWAVGAGD